MLLNKIISSVRKSSLQIPIETEVIAKSERFKDSHKNQSSRSYRVAESTKIPVIVISIHVISANFL